MLSEEEKEVGRTIKRTRQERALTQAQLAELIDTETTTISLYEGGKRRPGAMALKRLAVAMGVSTDLLLGMALHEHEWQTSCKICGMSK